MLEKKIQLTQAFMAWFAIAMNSCAMQALNVQSLDTLTVEFRSHHV